MKRFLSMTLLAAAMCSALMVGAQAADYSFETDGTPEYYPSTTYEDTFGSHYNYGGSNVVDHQAPELPYGSFSTTQTGVMEKALLPGLQQAVGGGSNGGSVGVAGGAPTLLPGVSLGDGATILPPVPAFTKLTDDFLLSNGAVGRISIPAIDISHYYVWEGETTASMKKGLGHFTGTSVWDGNVAVCGVRPDRV